MTPAAKLADDLRAAYASYRTGSDPWPALVPELLKALDELDRRQQAPQFIAIPRLK